MNTMHDFFCVFKLDKFSLFWVGKQNCLFSVFLSENISAWGFPCGREARQSQRQAPHLEKGMGVVLCGCKCISTNVSFSTHSGLFCSARDFPPSHQTPNECKMFLLYSSGKTWFHNSSTLEQLSWHQWHCSDWHCLRSEPGQIFWVDKQCWLYQARGTEIAVILKISHNKYINSPLIQQGCPCSHLCYVSTEGAENSRGWLQYPVCSSSPPKGLKKWLWHWPSVGIY